uniref:Uncharacterized protein n=1 Tax=viral metagenome TaxID=1070528 RepID=A0A6M3XKJ1_9ZZZZ
MEDNVLHILKDNMISYKKFCLIFEKSEFYWHFGMYLTNTPIYLGKLDSVKLADIINNVSVDNEKILHIKNKYSDAVCKITNTGDEIKISVIYKSLYTGDIVIPTNKWREIYSIFQMIIDCAKLKESKNTNNTITETDITYYNNLKNKSQTITWVPTGSCSWIISTTKQ